MEESKAHYGQWPLSERQRFLSEVNENLKRLIADTTTSFKNMDTTFHKYYTKWPEITRTKDPEVEAQVKKLAYYLQFVDVLRQRLEHIIRIHDQLRTDEEFGSAVLHVAIFHLHYFQLMTIEMDFTTVANTIESSWKQLNVITRRDQTENFYQDESFLPQHLSIADELKKLAMLLASTDGDSFLLPAPAFTADKEAWLNDIYSMEQERIVLTWFLNAMPVGSWSELSDHYKKSIYHKPNGNAEIF